MLTSFLLVSNQILVLLTLVPLGVSLLLKPLEQMAKDPSGVRGRGQIAKLLKRICLAA